MATTAKVRTLKPRPGAAEHAPVENALARIKIIYPAPVAPST